MLIDSFHRKISYLRVSVTDRCDFRCTYCMSEDMKFLPKKDVLSLYYKGKNISEILDLSIEETLSFFKNHKKIAEPLKVACDLGLGYLQLGQPSSSLSGGEAQRLKLVPYFLKKKVKDHLLILDEPTRGLHHSDIKKFLSCLKKTKATIVMTEHDWQSIAAADWIIDLGPGAAEKGGEILFQGPSAELLKEKKSTTAKWFLKS